MRFCELCGKEVINVRDGSLVGCVNDIGFEDYLVFAIFVRPSQSFVKKIFPWFFHCEEIEIPIREIENISGDVILVKFH